MKTHILQKQDVKRAAKYIQQGELVAFPTETVYGLGANAYDTNAAQKIYTAKWRPSDNPLIVHIYRKKQLQEIAHIPDAQKQNIKLLVQRFWPGPLTLILPKKECVPLEVSGGLDTVAVRMPKNRIARELIRLADCPIAAPSANISGKPSGTEFSHVFQDFDGKIACIIQASRCSIGLESTVVDMSGDTPLLLRPGGIDYEELISLLPDLEIGYGKHIEKPKSPGMKYQHYSPEAKVILFKHASVSQIQEHKKQLEHTGKKVRVLASQDIPNFGKKLFSLLREADTQGYDIILLSSIEETGKGRAIMNRLEKAASEII